MTKPKINSLITQQFPGTISQQKKERKREIWDVKNGGHANQNV